MFTGCNNEKEDVKEEYLKMKSQLLDIEDFSDEVNCDISVSIDRIDEEKVSYKVVISNPKENMNSVKAILIHNYYTEELFSSVGLFDDTVNIRSNSDDNLELSGDIKTNNDIDNLNLVLKLYIKYLDDSGVEKDIYYKATK